MKVLFSYVHNSDPNKDWGDGWGATLIKVLDLSAMKKVTFNIKWDGSSNALRFGFKDQAKHSFVAIVPNSALMALGSSYGQISIPVSSFAEDTTDPSRTHGAINWNGITDYGMSYLNKGTSTTYQYIDDITAVTTDETPVPPSGDSPVITNITPSAAPTGTQILVTGLKFAPVQGMSTLVFTNLTTNVPYNAEIISWSDAAIQARVPRLASIGTYEVRVNKLSTTSGVVTVLTSNPAGFQVTSLGGDSATIYPNPFNPNKEVVNIGYTTPAGATNIGVYIFDMTARQVSKTVIGASQTTWDGKDQNGQLVGDGVYLLRVINEDTKSLIAKGKILVVKH
jgi:flagellar hook assembly protein FlgD